MRRERPCMPSRFVRLVLGAMVLIGPRAKADDRSFDIEEYRIEGNTVLTEVEIDNAVEPFLGPGKHVSDIEAAAQALNRVYRDHGYETVSATIPVQHVVDGVIALKVIERRIGRVQVTGSRYFDIEKIKQAAPSLATGSVPNFNQVQNEIVALNQLADRGVVPNLREGKAPDTVDVDLEVHDKLPLHASLELNNRAAPSTTPLRLSGSVNYTNLWQRGDAIAAQFQVAPERTADTLVFTGSYLYHVPGTPISIVGSYLHSNSNVATLGSTTVVGRGDDAGLHAIVPLGGSGEFIHSADIGIDYKRFYEADTFGGRTTLAPLTWEPLSAAYSAVWSSPASTTTLNASVAFTLAGLGSNTVAYQQKRAYATPNFVVLRAAGDHTQTIWQGAQVSAHASVQVAPQPLISNEQFSLGGLDTVRGYLEGSALGDYGAAVQTELRSPPAPRSATGDATDLRGFFFFDAGSAAIDNPLPGQTHAYSLSSTGLGMRAKVFDSFSGEVIGAYPFAGANGTKASNPRILFRISAGL